MDVSDLEQDIIKLSRLHNLTKAEVRKIWNYQFIQIMRHMKEDKEYSMKVRGLGQFNHNPFAEEIVKERKKQKK